VEIKQNLEM